MGGSFERGRPGGLANGRSWRRVALVVAVAVGLQVLVWGGMFYVLNVLRLGPTLLAPFGDVPYYHTLAAAITSGQLAYRDFGLEYPPLVVPLLALPGGGLSLADYGARFALEMVGLCAVAAALTALAADPPPHDSRRPFVVAGVFALVVLACGTIIGQRYDIAVAAVLALALLLMARGRWEWAAAALGIGFALKVTPALLLPLVLVLAPGRKRLLVSLASFTAAAVAPFVPFLMGGGGVVAGLDHMMRYHLDRPLEFETVLGTPLLLLNQFGMLQVKIIDAAGGQAIESAGAGPLASLSTALVALLIGCVCYLVWRRRDIVREAPRTVFLAALAVILGSIVFSKVFSPQYLVWTLPVIALAAVDRKLLGGLVVGALFLTQVFFPTFYYQFVKLETNAVMLVATRNLLLVVALAVAMWQLWRLLEPGPPAQVKMSAKQPAKRPAQARKAATGYRAHTAGSLKVRRKP